MSKSIGTGPNQVPTNADLGTMAYQDYHAVLGNDGSSASLAIKTNSDVKNIAWSGPIWFDLGYGAFKTYVDVSFDDKGIWALVAKQGGTDMGNQTFQSGQYDVFDINAHGDMGNTGVSNTSRDQISRDNCNELFRLNGQAYIMCMEQITQGHCSAYNHSDKKAFIKKVTNQSTFDAWHGMFLNSLWGSDDPNTCHSHAPNGGSAFKITGFSGTQTWHNNYTDFDMTHGTSDLRDWDCNDEVSYGMPNNTMKVSRHGPILTDWTGGCQWSRGLRSNGYHQNWDSSCLVWVKI